MVSTTTSQSEKSQVDAPTAQSTTTGVDALNMSKVSSALQDTATKNPLAAYSERPRFDVLTRFPPEPAGFLHLGHVKAALHNYDYAHSQRKKGKKTSFILRFDDTNPDNAKSTFVDIIKNDLITLGLTPDDVTYTSDHFQFMVDCCRSLIEEGKAYADKSTKEDMKHQRDHNEPSPYRDLPAAESLKHFQDMLDGAGDCDDWCIRAKITYDHKNGAMRDPVMYRVQRTPHYRTGTKFNAYPTYDFSCSVIDAMQGVTHAFRTTEYHDRNAPYQWFLRACGFTPKIVNDDFSSLSFTDTLLSKRKLRKLINDGLVSGWDDPRLPTLSGVFRAGLTVDAIKLFLESQLKSKKVVLMGWDSIWATNKKCIDPIAARYFSVDTDNIVKASVVDVSGNPVPTGSFEQDKTPRQAKNPLGTRKVETSSSVVIDQADAKDLQVGELITLMHWGNVKVLDKKLSTDNIVTSLSLELADPVPDAHKLTSKKLTWLSASDLVPIVLVELGPLITKPKLEPSDQVVDFFNRKSWIQWNAVTDGNVAKLQEGDVLQFDRKGYFRIDQTAKDRKPMVMIKIPTGKMAKK